MIKLFITFIILITGLMLITLLFDWSFIQQHWTRQAIVLFLLLAFAAVCILVIKEQIKELKN